MGRAIQRSAAIGLLILALAVAWAGIAAPYLARRAALEERIVRAETVAQRFAEALVAAEGGEVARFPAGLVLDGASQAVAQAGLQERLDAALETSGGKRTASIALDPSEAAEQLHLRARVEGEVTIDALVDLLHRLETSHPLVFVETLEIVRRNRFADEGNDDLEGPVPLDLRLTASAPVDVTPKEQK